MVGDDSIKLDCNNEVLAAVTTLEYKVDTLSLKFDQLSTTISPSSSQPKQNLSTTFFVSKPSHPPPTTTLLPTLFHSAPPKFHYHSTFHPTIPTPDPSPKPPQCHYTLPPQPTYIDSDDKNQATVAHPFFGSDSKDKIKNGFTLQPCQSILFQQL
ncbi:LOW QUALITY PROTEIN: hypothetical protein PanWU01x14_335230 [Parasponia andersonii]|uniref:Uncharacterized protein n=1 Tax=Parasponia andersonii TaxID=3476 RepID=A0A2P5AGC7_PARAD|nr:LOW QUALITY PROTEIN: hypothetical protein PanWU01x14_335230 [Parasponia andersonii]